MQFPHARLGWKLTAACLAAGSIILLAHTLELYLPDLETWVRGLGPFAPLGFVLLFTALAPVFVSVDALCFAAGVLFPLTVAETVTIAATYLSAGLIFYLGRYWLRDKVTRYLSTHPRFAALDRLLGGNRAFKAMLLLRLTPLPFAMLSYALSVTEVKFRPYLGATTGILIYNASLTYLGYAAKHLAGRAANPSAETGLSHFTLIFGLLAAVSVLIVAAKLAGRYLKALNGNPSAQ